MVEIVNTRLLSHPINWLFVGAVMALAAMTWHVLASNLTTADHASIAPD